MDRFVIATKRMRVDEGGDLRTQDRVTDLENEDESEDEEGAVGEASAPAASAAAPSLTQDWVPENVEQEAWGQGSASRAP